VRAKLPFKESDANRTEDLDRAAPQKRSAKKPRPQLDAVHRGLDVRQIEMDPGRFSYQVSKAPRLLDVHVFQPMFAGIISVWFSPDRRFWLVDGHQRLGLAKRLGITRLNVQVLDSGDTYHGAIHPYVDEVACRAFAALMNFDNNGYEMDLSKFTKDLNDTVGALKDLLDDNSKALYNRLNYLLSLSRILLMRADSGDMRWSHGHKTRISQRNMLAEIRKLLASEDREFLASEVKSKLGVDASNEKSFYSALAKLHNLHQIVRVSRARYKAGTLGD
jgi:hypothetical protein